MQCKLAGYTVLLMTLSLSKDTDATGSAAINWGRVGLFYAIAFGGAVIVTGVIAAVSSLAGPSGIAIGQIVTAVLYMPLPLVASVIVERRAGRRLLLADEWARLRTAFWRTIGPSMGFALLVIALVLVLGFAVAALAGLAGIPGAGRLVAGQSEFQQHLVQIVPGAAGVALPPIAVVASSILSGIVAGFTINAVFAFGEEYGWRGVLADELRGLGAFRANLIIGVLWGLWHAPIILVMGHNYPTQRGWGVLMMVAWTVPLSFLLWWVRERSGSVLAPACLHGAFNGTIGLFALVIVGGAELVALPMGILLAVTLAVLALALWGFWPPRARTRLGATPSR